MNNVNKIKQCKKIKGNQLPAISFFMDYDMLFEKV